jgi:hypothetical protein
LILSLRGLGSYSAQVALDEALGDVCPDGWLLLLDGLSMKSSLRELLSAATLTQMIRRRGAPVLIARSGPMRRLWFALADGVEVALGRLERFKIADHRNGRGPGHNPPRWECPDLLCSLPQALARPLLERGLLAECSCSGCSTASSVAERLANAHLHNASIIQQDLAEASGRTPLERLYRLETTLRAARSATYDLEGSGVAALSQHLSHLKIWPEACAAMRSTGLVADTEAA